LGGRGKSTEGLKRTGKWDARGVFVERKGGVRNPKWEGRIQEGGKNEENACNKGKTFENQFQKKRKFRGGTHGMFSGPSRGNQNRRGQTRKNGTGVVAWE